MKSQTSEFIDNRTRVASIANLLLLGRATSRHPVSDGTYVYFFRKPQSFSLVKADSYLRAKLQADPSFTFVSIQQPADDTVTLQLDPRDIHQRKIKPAKAAEVRKVPLSELFNTELKPKAVQRYFRVVAIEHGVAQGYLVTAANVKLVVDDYHKQINDKCSDTTPYHIQSIIEISAMSFVMFSLTGHYEVVNLWNPQD